MGIFERTPGGTVLATSGIVYHLDNVAAPMVVYSGA
jgi:hypothetical protein